MTNTGGCDKSINFLRILMTFAKFLFSNKRKMAFLAAKFFEAYLS